jgi:hypothetical protein
MSSPSATTDTDQLLNLSTFQGKFDVTEFIGAASEKLIAQSKAEPGRTCTVSCSCSSSHAMITAFDPKPFVRTFEDAVDRLIAIRKDVQVKTEQMEKGVRVAEREYSKKMADLSRGFEVRFHCEIVARHHEYQMSGSWSIVYWYGEQDERGRSDGYKNRYRAFSFAILFANVRA